MSDGSGASANPLNVSAADTYTEQTTFNGDVFGGYAYGIHTVLYIICVYRMLHNKRMRDVSWTLLGYTTALFISASVYFAADTKWTQQLFIDYGNVLPGGPIEFLNVDYTISTMTLGNAAFVTTNALADGLLLYRTWVIWDRNWLVILLPILMYLASTALSIIYVVEVALPTVGLELLSLFEQGALPYFALSMSLQIILTLMIAGRLMHARRRLQHVLGPQHARLYTSVSAVLVESATLSATFSLMFIVTFVENNSIFNWVLPIQGQVMAIGPLLILLRVAHGRAYSEQAATGTQVQFRQPGNTSTTAASLPMSSMRGKTARSTGEDSTVGFDAWPITTTKSEEA